MAKYTMAPRETALGVEYLFTGPGISRYTNGVHVLQPLNDFAKRIVEEERDGDLNRTAYEAEAVLRLVNSAYEAGFQAAKKELREWLGVPQRKWGDPL